MQQLTAARVPFVHATVVRAQVPSSAHAGDEAIVLADGTIDGFVGGVCAETSVRTAALGALDGGGPLLLRVLPEDETGFPEAPGARVVVNPCLSGGALEIFLEPRLPSPLVEIVGRTPVADAVAAMCELLGYTAARSLPSGHLSRGTDAVVVASHGRDEEESLRSALAAEVPYIALVASRGRGASVLAGLDLPDADRARISSPAGLDIGARTAPEVALSILAEIITSVRTRRALPTREGAPAAARSATDPVCGMTVTVLPDTPHLTVGGADLWFCGTHCRDRYASAQHDE
ncbi:XdhC family protein [Streptomyces sp. NPDC002499]